MMDTEQHVVRDGRGEVVRVARFELSPLESLRRRLHRTANEASEEIAARTAEAMGRNDPAAIANLRAMVSTEAFLALRQFGDAVTAMFEAGFRSPVVLQTLYECTASKITERVLRRVGAGTNGAGIHALGDTVIVQAVRVFGASLNETLTEWQRTNSSPVPVATDQAAAKIETELKAVMRESYKAGFAAGRAHERRTVPLTAKQRRQMARAKSAA